MILPGAGVALGSTGGSAVETIIWTDEFDLKSLQTVLFNMGGTSVVFIDEVGVVCTEHSGVISAAPTVQWGVVGDTDKYKAASQLSDLTAANLRQFYSTLLTDEGEAAPAIEVTIAATGTGTIKGKAYMKVTVKP